MKRVAIPVLTAVALWGMQGNGPSGHWEGVLETPNGDLQIEIDLAPDSGGTWMGAISIPAQGTKGLGLIDLSVKEKAVAFGLKAPGNPRFDATVSEDGSKLSGQLTQGGATIPFTLKRTGDAKLEKPIANAPLTAELEGTWDGTLDAGARQLRLRFVLANEGGAGKGRVISLDQGDAEIPIAKITQTGSRVKMELPVVSGEFEGEIKGNQITGEWSQAGKQFPTLTLTRKAAGAK